MTKTIRNYMMLLIAALSACTITSCSSEDKDDVVSDNGIEGKWLMTRMVWKAVESGETYSDEEDVTADGIVWDFMSNGTLNTYEDDELDETLKWSLKSNKLTIKEWDDEDEEYYSETYSVSISSGKMVIKYSEKDEDGDEYYEEYHFVRYGNSSGDKPSADASIVGKWAISKVTEKQFTTIPELKDYYDNEDVSYGEGEYWEFTSSKLTVHDPTDVMNGKAVGYTYNKSKGELAVTGWLTYKVVKLTSRQMTLTVTTSDEKFGMTQTIEFEKI